MIVLLVEHRCFRSKFTVLFINLQMSTQSLTAGGSDLPLSHKSVVSITHEQNIISSKTLICRQLFAGHVVSSWSMKRKKKMHRMIIGIPRMLLFANRYKNS